MTRTAITALLAATVLSACDSAATGDAAVDSGVDAGHLGRDAGPVPVHSCGQPGVPGNANGVGAFCTPMGHECSAFPLAPICVVDLDPVDGQWYCTRLCSTSSECGPEADCVGDSRGMGCFPQRCYRDAGVDAGDDAAAVDAGTDDAGTDDAGVMDGGGSLDASTAA